MAYQLAGIFDGHGGEECSVWAVSHVSRLVDIKLREAVQGDSQHAGLHPYLHHDASEHIFLDAAKQALDTAIRSLDSEILEVRQNKYGRVTNLS